MGFKTTPMPEVEAWYLHGGHASNKVHSNKESFEDHDIHISRSGSLPEPEREPSLVLQEPEDTPESREPSLDAVQEQSEELVVQDVEGRSPRRAGAAPPRVVQVQGQREERVSGSLVAPPEQVYPAHDPKSIEGPRGGPLPKFCTPENVAEHDDGKFFTPENDADHFGKFFTPENVSEHDGSGPDGSTWIVFEGSVYDVTSYIQKHPGGAGMLMSVAGRDATAEFEDVGHSSVAREKMAEFLIGTLDGRADSTDFGRSVAGKEKESTPYGWHEVRRRAMLNGRHGVLIQKWMKVQYPGSG